MCSSRNVNVGKGEGMKEVITTILTDSTARDTSDVEESLMKQAVASPWSSLEEI